ncbi:MAG TPA: hypothetical protein VER12_05200 [Polyangiaceae bacterium]|nr:hypothetical protein [Polyangiaceae bacterium]
MASSANAYDPSNPLAVATEASARDPEAEPGPNVDQTRVDAALLVVEVPIPVALPLAAPHAAQVPSYSSYEPGVVVAQKYPTSSDPG